MNRSMERRDQLVALTHRLRESKQISEDEATLLYSVSESEWDDAVHIEAPWREGYTLCASGPDRNLVALDAPRPDGWAGCWSCLQIADKLDETHSQADRIKAMQEHYRPAVVALRMAQHLLYVLPKKLRKEKRRKQVLEHVGYALHGEWPPKA